MRAYLALAKPRIAAMVAVTAAFGWAMAGGKATPAFFVMLAGVTLASAACGALNQRLERVEDSLMRRTRARPLPTGRISPRAALVFGLSLSAAGPLLVWLAAGLLPAALTAGTIALYVLGYTPLKKVTPQTTWLGAAAGATPPLIGWAAAAGTLGPKAWALFGIQFLWQIPHFLALFWIYREDYARAGFKVLPVVHPDGGTTAAQIALHSFTLLPATLLPVLLGMAGLPYAVCALSVGVVFLVLGLRTSWTLENVDARRLFLASLAYLPLIYGMLYFGGV
ncbi:MAG: heme o synthase [Elusimicrobia bacterium]|nr:heme o synthase [Elusimicrobiota bacterium]